MDVILKKLEQDLKKQLEVYCIEQQYPLDTIDDMIQEKLKSEQLNFKKRKKDETKCQTRIWNNGSACQCLYKKKDGTDYCNVHNRMLKTEGVLRFGDIREPKPRYDQIKLKNGIEERLPWVHSDPLIRLQNVLDKQQVKIIETTPKSIVR
tara:strand:- start:7 stop:456 length:450 start_codon:yes stop_codon:yes gene_type:complete